MFELEKGIKEPELDYYKGLYYKFYKKIQFYSVFDVIEMIQKANLPITNIKLNEIADVGLYYFGGNYSLEGFYKVYERINQSDLEDVVIEFGSNYRLFVKDNVRSVTFVCEQDEDLNEVLKLK